MEQMYFTRDQATAIAQHYQLLIGRRLDEDQPWLIDCVAVAPVSKLDQWLFAHFYVDSGSAEQALAFYRHPEFDVMVLAVCNSDTYQIVFKDLRTYLGEQGMMPDHRLTEGQPAYH